MTVSANQLAAMFKGMGEPTVLAEMAFAYQQATGVAQNQGYLSVPAANANSGATQPDSASNSITSDITIELDILFTDYTNRQTLGFKYDGLTNNRSWYWQILAGGTMRWQSSPDGIAAPNNDATATLAAAGAAAGARHIFRISHQMNDGAGHNVVTPEFSDNGGASWTPIGAPIINAGAQAGIFDSNAIVNLIGGTAEFASDGARVYAFRLYAGVGGGKVLKQSLDFTTAADHAATVADNVSGTWSIGADSTVLNPGGNPYAPAKGTIYLADRPYSTGPADAPPNTIYRDVIASAPDFERAIDVKNMGGRSTRAVGTFTLNNGDGALDYMLDLIVDGYDIAFYVGDRSWARADFKLVNVASVVYVQAQNDKQILLTLRDKNTLLDATIAGGQIASGPNLGKLKPVLLGQVSNLDLTPYLVDAAGPTYVFNYAPVASYDVVADVRDSGVTLIKSQNGYGVGAITANTATDTITTSVAHGLAADDVVIFLISIFAGLSVGVQYWVLASGLTTTDFKVSATRGGAAADITGTVITSVTIYARRFYVDINAATIMLSSSPSGRATMDYIVNGTSAFQQVPHTGFRYVLDTFTRLTIAERDDAAFTAMSTDQLAKNFYWGIAILDRMNVLDLLDVIAVLTNSWYGWTSAGLLTVGKLDLKNLDSVVPVDAITDGDMETEPSLENLVIQFGKVVLNALPNVVQQTDGLASSLTTTQRNAYAPKFRVQVKTTDPGGGSYLAQWWTYHKTAIDSKPVDTYLSQQTAGTSAQGICNDRTDLFKPWTRVLRCTVGLDKYQRNPGDPVLVTYPRYGLTGGKNFRVASVKTRVSDRAVDLVLVRQSIPDYLSSSHV